MSAPTSYELAMLATSLTEGEPDESHFERAWDIYQKADAFRHKQANPEAEFVKIVSDIHRDGLVDSLAKVDIKGLLAFRYKSDDECPARQYLREKGRPMQRARTVTSNLKSFLAHMSETAKPEDKRRFDYKRGEWSSQVGPNGEVEDGTIWIHAGVLDYLIKWKRLKKSEGGHKANKKRRSKKKPKPAKK